MANQATKFRKLQEDAIWSTSPGGVFSSFCILSSDILATLLKVVKQH
ncbi:hypothetical protein [Anabaena sp. UHCC 0204]|nr:hypothetical protein [Anabaena sp. UHCC 0204]